MAMTWILLVCVKIEIRAALYNQTLHECGNNMTYLNLKYLHMALVLLSVLLFNGRFLLRMSKPQDTLPKWLKILPHVNDTLLLGSGLVLVWLSGWVPFGNASWLGWKLVLLVVYVGLGHKAMKTIPQFQAWLWWVLAIACVSAMAALVMHKPLLG